MPTKSAFVSAFLAGSIASAVMARQGLPSAPASVAVSQEQGIEFVTISDVGNAGFPRSTLDWTGFGRDREGRGSVPYAYRMARTEVTSAQWMEFLNTFAPRPMPESVSSIRGLQHDFYLGPLWSGMFRAEFDPLSQTSRYEMRTDSPDAPNMPVWSLSWRMAAVYCNWLHNGKSSDWNALLSGAYDTSGWSFDPDTGFSDDPTREAGARFWIPTLDEWAKAAYYDPNKNGPGVGGWWDRHYGSDAPPVPGLPGTPGAQTSSGIPQIGPLAMVGEIPLAAYSAMSPWGLFDTIGGTTEIVAELGTVPFELPQYHMLTMGPYAGSPTDDPYSTEQHLINGSLAFSSYLAGFDSGYTFSGLRVAAAVPGPAAATILTIACLGILYTRNRR